MTDSKHPIDDARFLRRLFDEFSAGQYAQDSVQSGSLDFSEQWETLITSRPEEEHDREAFTEAFAEVESLENTFRGAHVEALRADALSMCGMHKAALEHVHVGIVPIGSLNGQTITTPSGGEVVLLNHALLPIIPLVVECILAIATWHTPEPYATGASQAAFAESVAGLARVAVSGDTRQLGIDDQALFCLDHYDPRAHSISFTIQLFILLHEFGHITIDGRRRTMPMPEMNILSKQEQAWRDEFAADEFAVSCLLSGRFTKGDVAFVAGCLIGFMLVCESLPQYKDKLSKWSHPSSFARWRRIKHLTASSELRRDSPAYYLDGIVDFVIGQAHMATLHRQLVQLVCRRGHITSVA